MLAANREEGGAQVRAAWIRWAQRQPSPKPSWLVSWKGLPESDKEADRQIWDAIVAPYNDAVTALQRENKELRKELDKHKSTVR